MVDVNALGKAAIGLSVATVAIVVFTVTNDKIGNVLPLASDGNLTPAGYASANGTSLLGSVLSDWGSIIVLGIILVTVLAPLLFVLLQVARNQGGR